MNQYTLSFIMQAEVETRSWSAYVHTGSQFRFRSSVTAQFANGRSVNLAVGLPDIGYVRSALRKDLPSVMWRAHPKTSAGDNAEA
jgi:hypothetical protein